VAKLSPLASAAATQAVLEKHGLATKKALGQHFLVSDGIVRRICDLAALHPGDRVLEVGPGIGTLTIALLQKAGSVVAVERDRDLVAVLADTCSAYPDSLEVINKDALELVESDLEGDMGSLPHKFVANLPYAVAATLVLGFFERFPSLESATVMVQSEVADRMCAKPGTKAYGAYTVKLSLFARPVERFCVGPQNFFPPPRVDSAVLRLDRHRPLDAEGAALPRETVQAACLMADAAFAHRRKTILNSATSYFEAQGKRGAPRAQGKRGAQAKADAQAQADVQAKADARAQAKGDALALPQALLRLFEQAGIDPRQRGEALTAADFARLGHLYRENFLIEK